MSDLSLLVVGGTQVGKTHYGGQLFRRLQDGKSGQIQIDGMPDSVEPLKDVLISLSRGRSADHTSTEVYEEIVLPFSWGNGIKARLVWPDYGGEQIEQIVKNRRVPHKWTERIQSSDGWLFFIRPSKIRPTEDILTRPRSVELLKHTSARKSRENETSVILSDQAYLVELLQILLYVRGIGIRRRLRSPSLVILLSCWDEVENIGEPNTPVGCLHRFAPMVSSFVESNWHTEAMEVYCLSSLGRSLSSDTQDRAFISAGPEKQGWVITPSGDQSTDLTIPIVSLMRKVAAR
jgi:hypothetical protein